MFGAASVAVDMAAEIADTVVLAAEAALVVDMAELLLHRPFRRLLLHLPDPRSGLLEAVSQLPQASDQMQSAHSCSTIQSQK